MGAAFSRPATKGAGPRRAVLIAGPTASGKSALALSLAERFGAAIVNADAMQVYAGMGVITAAPGSDELARAPHMLFGHVPPSEAYSTGRWLADVSGMLEAIGSETLIFVGGTGLYLDALINGFAPVPVIAPEVVERIELEVAGLDRQGREALVMSRDPLIAPRLKGYDPQRVIRALSVLEATGRSLAIFQDEVVRAPLEGIAVDRIVLTCDRDLLAGRIARRFELMLEQGAIVEVQALLRQQLDPALPAMKALGVSQIAAWLAGELTREQMTEQAVIATRQYAKRQRTWFRNRFADWRQLSADLPIDPAAVLGDG